MPNEQVVVSQDVILRMLGEREVRLSILQEQLTQAHAEIRRLNGLLAVKESLPDGKVPS